jgi:hypothetical protein
MKANEIMRIYLTQEERDKLLGNLDTHEYRQYLIEKDYNSPERLIDEAIVWDCSNEGEDYWYDIFNRIEDGVIMKEPIVPAKIMDKMIMT